MKTFEEAIAATMILMPPPGETFTDEQMQSIPESAERFHGVHAEVQCSPLTEMVADAFLLVSQEMSMPTKELLAAVFSHGVMVGIEMEKAE